MPFSSVGTNSMLTQVVILLSIHPEFILCFFCFPSFSVYQVYCVLGVVMMALLIVYDTKLNQEFLSYDEYVLGAVNLYLDFINMFLFILNLLSGGRE